MAIELLRGCGFRKVNALYLVCDGPGVACGRLPLPLCVCPVCGQGIKQGRGWQWVRPKELFGQASGVRACGGPQCDTCPVSHLEMFGDKAGLMWVGQAFYPMPAHFIEESRQLGISKRIATVPRGFKVGEHWVLLAHPRAYRDEEGEKPGIFTVFKPSRIEKILTESQATEEVVEKLKKSGVTPVLVPDNDSDHQGTVYDQQEALRLD